MTTLTIYYDYTDPWSYVALFRAQWLQSEVSSLSVTWHPFEVYPDVPLKGARPQNPAFMRRKTQYDIDVISHDLPVRIVVPYDRVTNSRLALAGSLVAAEYNLFDRYHHAMFRAFFEHGRNIADPNVVADVAGSVGIEVAVMREALEQESYRRRVAHLRDEAEEFGIVAVPTFVANNHGVVGIVANEALLRVVTSASPPITA